MLSPDQMQKALLHIKIKNLASEINVTPYLLRKMREGDNFVAYSAFKKVSDYFEGVSNED